MGWSALLCKVGRATQSLPAYDVEVIDTWARTGAYGTQPVSGKIFAQALTNIGYPVSEAVARRHRAHSCACFTT